MEPTESSFFLQISSVNTVFSFLSKIDEKKATGLDRILSKLLKMAASIAPSLTSIFSESMLTGYIQTTGKRRKELHFSKKALKNRIQTIIDQYISVIPVV